jgi:hypothetical protein
VIDAPAEVVVSNTSSNTKKRHHFVSACHLRHFAVPPDRYAGKLFAYDRRANRTLPPMSPDALAFQRHFYRVEGSAPQIVEDAYATHEALFAPVLAGVVQRGTLPSDPVEMRKLLAFVATQATRTPRVREMQERHYSDTMMLMLHTHADNKPAYIKALRAEHPDMTDDELEDDYADLRAFLNAKGARVEIEQSEHVMNALEFAPELEDVLAERCWILGRAVDDGALFVTTDDPVHLQPDGRGRPVHPLWSPGFGDPDTNVVVTMSPRLVLMGLSYEFTAAARIRLSRREVAAINTDLALRAHRFVYSPRPTFVQIDASGAVVDGPTDALRWIEQPDPAARMGFFTSSAVAGR